MTEQKRQSKDTCMKFYDAFRLLYLETDVSDVSLGVVLSLHVRDDMISGDDEVPDNATLHQIAFTS